MHPPILALVLAYASAALAHPLAATKSSPPVPRDLEPSTTCAAYFAPTDHGTCFGRQCGPQGFHAGETPTHCWAVEPTNMPAAADEKRERNVNEADKSVAGASGRATMTADDESLVLATDPSHPPSRKSSCGSYQMMSGTGPNATSIACPADSKRCKTVRMASRATGRDSDPVATPPHTNSFMETEKKVYTIIGQFVEYFKDKPSFWSGVHEGKCRV